MALVSADLLCTPSTQSRILRASIEVQQDVAPPVIEVLESPPPVAVCRAAEEVANLEDMTIMEQAPAAGKMTRDLLQPPLHITPPRIDALSNDDNQYMVPDDHDEFLDFSAEDSHPIRKSA